MMSACLVPGRAAALGDEVTDRPGTLDLPDFREADRVPALDLDLGLVIRSSEGCATLSAAPQSRLRKFEQVDKWSFCLTAGTLVPANQERR